MVTVEVLGAVQAHEDGVRLAVPDGRTAELLARLAVDAGTRVRADRLLADLWDGPAGRNTLQATVSRLRRALRDRALVVGALDGYTLAVAPEAVDATRAVALAAAARAAGDPAATLRHARAGLALFRGDVLGGAGAWAQPYRTRWEELRLGLAEDALAARVELGAGGDVVGELEALLAEHPLREGLWVTLITALYRCGRQADALAAYRRVRYALAEELGVEPGPALQEAERRVLRQDPGLTAGRPRAAVPGNLPEPAGPLTGRAADADALAAALAAHRLVTVVGPAGVGKTRLALDVARRPDPPGGVWLVRLDALDGDAAPAGIVAETLQVGGGVQDLRERLAGAETLLVLDNCEHVAAGVAALAGSLLDGAPALRVLATSQVPLGIEHEHVHPLAPLGPDDSVALFLHRARELRPRLVLDAAVTAAAADVCRSLDGLPLAIELAAARVRSLSVPDIARRIDDRFTLLRDPTSRLPARRRALEAAIAWSYELLFPDDQRGLWAFSCFAGSTGLDAVEHVLAALAVPAGAALDTVGRLVDRSLVTLDEAPDGGVRYRLLDSIRAYAAARLAESGLAGDAAAAHAGWYAALADRCDADVRGPGQAACVAVARAERTNVDEALAWCAGHDPALGARIAIGFGWTWVVLGDGVAGAARVRRACAAAGSPRERAIGLLLAGWLEASAGDVTLAASDLDAARAIATATADEALLADVDRHRAFVAIQQGRPDVVRAAAARSAATCRALDRPWPLAGSLLLAAYGAIMSGDIAAAAADARRAVEILRPIDDSWGMVHAQAMLGGIAEAQHRFADAAGALAAAADESARLGFTGQAALHRAGLARVRQRMGDARAADTYRRAVADAVAGGDGRLAATARVHLARLLLAAGDPASARALLEDNQRWYRGAGGGEHALLTACILASVNDDAVALRAVLAETAGPAETGGRAGTTGQAQARVHALDALARLAAAAGDGQTARTLLLDADRLAAGLIHVLDPADRFDALLARGTRA